MVPALLQVHSATRYLVLTAALIALGKLAFSRARRQPFGEVDRLLGSTFLGLLDFQIALGVAMVAGGVFYRALIGHMVLMLSAAGVAHGALVANRRRRQPGLDLPLAAVAAALLLMAVGIAAIGRGLLEARAL